MTKSESLWDVEREVRTVVHRVRRTSIANAELIDPDLPATAYAVLLFIFDNGLVRPHQLVESLGVDKATISRQITQLENLELVTRNWDPSDRRAQMVTLTPEGQSRVSAVTQQRRAEFMDRLSDWSSKDLTLLATALSRYNAALES